MADWAPIVCWQGLVPYEVSFDAMRAFTEEGYLVQLPESKYQLAGSFANQEAASTIEGRLIGFCEFVSN